MLETQPMLGVDWASTPDGSYFYASGFPDRGNVYGTLTWTEPGRAAVTIYGKEFDRVDGYLDAAAMSKIITRQEFDMARSLEWPPIADVKRHLGLEA